MQPFLDWLECVACDSGKKIIKITRGEKTELKWHTLFILGFKLTSSAHSLKPLAELAWDAHSFCSEKCPDSSLTRTRHQNTSLQQDLEVVLVTAYQCSEKKVGTACTYVSSLKNGLASL